MKAEIEIHKLADKLPKVSEGILCCIDDGFWRHWSASTVKRSMVVTEVRTDIPNGIQTNSYETQEPLDETSYPYVDLENGRVLHDGYYILLSEIEKIFPLVDNSV